MEAKAFAELMVTDWHEVIWVKRPIVRWLTKPAHSAQQKNSSVTPQIDFCSGDYIYTGTEPAAVEAGNGA